MIEKHPWVKFPKAEDKAIKLILGSFPPIKFTVSKENMTQCDMDFFYCSRDNFLNR